MWPTHIQGWLAVGLGLAVAVGPAAVSAQCDEEAAAASAPAPLRLGRALGAPSWLALGFEQRTRFEHFAGDLRAASRGDAAALAMRSLLDVEVRVPSFRFGVELIDGRAYASDSTPLNTTIVDSLDLLQAYGTLVLDGVLVAGGQERDSLELTVGRQTLDLGSRRLLARNEFRNTINAFTGLHLEWSVADRHRARAWLLMPVHRRPADPERLAGNDHALDVENPRVTFWGLFAGASELGPGLRLEGYVLGLHEADGPDLPSTNRQLVTPGFRLWRPPAAGSLDYELEAMAQLGASRRSDAAEDTAEDTADLAHLAFAYHAAVGYTLPVPWSPRLALIHDFATGDSDPDDDRNQRFDPLFGARRFEFGPTSLYGAIERSNLNGPALRIEVTPHPRVDALVASRLVWLASSRDAWATMGLHDPTGRAGSFVGHQLEARMRWHALPGSLSFDVGGAHFVRGRFAREAPGAREQNGLYLYLQVTGAV